MFQHISNNNYGEVKMTREDEANGSGCTCHLRAKKSAAAAKAEDAETEAAGGGGGGGGGVSPSKKHGTRKAIGEEVVSLKEAQAAAAAAPPVPAWRPDGLCGDLCENRSLRVECSGGEAPGARDRGAASPTGFGPGSLLESFVAANGAAAVSGVAVGGKGPKKAGDSKSKEKWSNCKCGPGACGNRQIGLRQGTVKLLPFLEEGMGWGLKTLEDLAAGQLVREYVGEVLTEAMLEARMAEHARTNPNDVNMYVMELENGIYLDARQKGNVSRFINHSCGPNCELQKWIVQGVTRIGIFATQDIPAGTALSYDYQFSTNEHGRFRCKCGAPTCRGSLSSQGFDDGSGGAGGKRKRVTAAERKELLKRARAAEARAAERAVEEVALKGRRQNLTARTLPGDPTTEVRRGPPQRTFATARDARLFLLRNLRGGADMLRRKELLQARAAAAAAAAQRTGAQVDGGGAAP